jgi:NADH:ubiquinone oxidoreductase subunit E
MTSKPNAATSDTNEHDPDEAREALRQRARTAIARQPARTVTILSSLLAAQDELGWLPAVAIDEVAERNGATPNAVWGIASFYPNFRFTVPNRHKVELCWGPTCHVLGAQSVLRGLLSRLGLTTEGETEDGVISLKLNTCLGVCAHAPAMSVDDELTGHIDLDLAIRLVERLKVEDEEAQRAIVLDELSAASRKDLRAKADARTAERAVLAAAKAEAEAEAEAIQDIADAKAAEEAAVLAVEAARFTAAMEAKAAEEAAALKAAEAAEAKAAPAEAEAAAEAEPEADAVDEPVVSVEATDEPVASVETTDEPPADEPVADEPEAAVAEDEPAAKADAEEPKDD